MKIPIDVRNPRYKGASMEDVAKALLRPDRPRPDSLDTPTGADEDQRRRDAREQLEE